MNKTAEPETVELYELDVIKWWKESMEELCVATASDWNTKPMPTDNHYVIKTKIPLPPVAMELIRHGHFPKEMEDKWFMYCEGDTIRYFRSWTGENIFNAYCEKANDGGYSIMRIEVNTDAYKNSPRHADKALEDFLELLSWQCGVNIDEQECIVLRDVPPPPLKFATKDQRPVCIRFKEWLFNNKKEPTARVYWSMLEHTLRRIIHQEIGEDADSIFSYTTKDELQECIDKLMALPSFAEINEKKHRAITAAINQYKKFIEQQ